MLGNNNQGRLLLEILLVILMAAFLVAFLTPAYFRYVEKSRLTSYLNTANDIKEYCELASLETSMGLEPDTETQLLDTVKQDMNSVDWENVKCDIKYDEKGSISALNVKYGDEKKCYEYVYVYDPKSMEIDTSKMESLGDGWFLSKY